MFQILLYIVWIVYLVDYRSKAKNVSEILRNKYSEEAHKQPVNPQH